MIRRVDDRQNPGNPVEPERSPASSDDQRRADGVVRAARRVLEIVPGERRLLPEFGCRVHSLGALRTRGERDLAAGLVEEALERWAPHLRVDRAEVSSAGDGWLRVALRSGGRWREFVMKHRVERAALSTASTSASTSTSASASTSTSVFPSGSSPATPSEQGPEEPAS